MKNLLFGIIATVLFSFTGNAQVAKREVGIGNLVIFVPSPTIPDVNSTTFKDENLNLYYTFVQEATIEKGLNQRFDKLVEDGVTYVIKTTFKDTRVISVSISASDQKVLLSQLQNSGFFNKMCPIVYCAIVSQSDWGFAGCVLHYLIHKTKP